MNVLALYLQAGGFLGSGLGGFALPVLVIGAMYFFMIAPNQKKQKAWAQMLASIKPSDKVTTTGGLRGTVLSVKDDVVTLRIQPDNLRLEFAKSAIASVVTEDPAA